MGKIRGNYENIRKRIHKYSESNFKYNCRIEEENLKIEKVKSDMMRYKIKINKLKTNRKTFDLKKSLRYDQILKKHNYNNTDQNNEDLFEHMDKYKNILLNQTKRIRSARLNLQNPNKKSNQDDLNYERKDAAKINKEKSIKLENDIKNNNQDDNENFINNSCNKENFDNAKDANFNLPNIGSNLRNSNTFEVPHYENTANIFMNYVFSSNGVGIINEKNNKNRLISLEDKKEYSKTIKIDKYLANTNQNFFKNKTEFEIYNCKTTNDIIFGNIGNLNFSKDENQNTLFKSKDATSKNFEKGNELYIEERDLNLDKEKNERIDDRNKNDLYLSQKQLIIDIIDNNPKIGNTVQHLTNTLSAHRNKLNKLLKEQTDFLFSKNKLQEMIYKIFSKYKKELRNDDNFIYNNHKNFDNNKNIIKTTLNINNDELNLLEIENIASERRKLIDLIVKDKEILLSYYDEKFPKVNAINKKFNPN